MKSKISNTPSLFWSSPIEALVKSKKPSPNVAKLAQVGIVTLYDLLWIIPLRIFKTPALSHFRDAKINEYFTGRGKFIHIDIKPAFGRRGKGNILLYNGYAVIKDLHSHETLSFRWFNLYPNQKKLIEQLEQVTFLGQIQEFKTQKQIVNPQFIDPDSTISAFIIDYPTINKVSGAHIKKFIDLIPKYLWDHFPETIPELGYNSILSLRDAFRTIHGLISAENFNTDRKKTAQMRLIYEEFLIDQLKIMTRRKFIKRKKSQVMEAQDLVINKLIKNLPFELTSDQIKVFNEVITDLKSGHPMMRMLQGDVGCGKTIVAFLATQIVISCGFQVALMCPTEALAIQHYESFKQLYPEQKSSLLIGSTTAKDKKEILKNLINGEIKIIIGTHALFQETVKFKNLGLAIIDEQHKFGVDQRLKLSAKGEGTHSLIMSATPIPRTLSLARYGDLDISSIKTMPTGRKGIKTRITEQINYLKYIDFIKSRLNLGEQAYFVFPAIEESETIDIQNVKESFLKYKKVFNGYCVEMLHGQMKPQEKENIVRKFRERSVHILISTSVIEVGINVPNATIMSIYNPERFGLSSLHQLRGRVGRGDKAGFCFLVLDKDISPEAHQRLKVIEENLDGFIIAEEDLKFRGEGDIFGVDQSGIVAKKMASFILHSDILEQVIKDLHHLQGTKPEVLGPHFERLAKDQKIIDTI